MNEAMNPIAENARPRLASKARLKWDEARKKHLLLFPEGLLVLNPTARDVVALCDGTITFAEMVKKLGEQYKTETVRADIEELLSRLADKGLVKIKDEG